ncbi:YrhC family protein [Desertibacillus haloalkaliphilus]|uniref:YrhC family protein n=1 Tax=Desertibacillus haloalkaliphilus TaxID=1328930 RepID=UPI001C25FF2A|nr:YrhC family protein [Desertibacillus haloalkaliphilus]MBU8905549.1 YrhC family protein [Desertibacillus haloalkaliphilus]
MQEKEMRELEGKINDYKRFSSILVSVSIFLFLGLVIPVEGKETFHSALLITGNLMMLAFSVIFHKKAVNAQEEMNQHIET